LALTVKLVANHASIISPALPMSATSQAANKERASVDESPPASDFVPNFLFATELWRIGRLDAMVAIYGLTSQD